MQARHTFPLLALTALAPIIWGSSYVVTTQALPPNSPLLAATLRALPAGALLLLLTRQGLQGQWWLRLPLLGLLNIGLFFYCLFYSAERLPGGIAAMLMAIQPLLVMALSRLLLGSSVRPQQLLAGIVGLVGIGLLVVNQQAQLDPAGIALALLGALSMAVGVTLTKRWGRPKGMSMLGFTGWQLLFGGLMLLPITLLVEPLPPTLSALNYLGFGYLSLVGALLAYTLWFRGIEKLDPVTVSFLGFLSSVSASVLGYLLLDQSLTLLQGLGAAAILLSIVLASQGERRQHTSQHPTLNHFSQKELL
ncbi:EamA family transporter [Aliagarivorans taiwanensis]|uniref:EamA family transporter n=1 Tax=Aliagarivorans taiwanensis TaxID=561966 RepID=UPI00040F18C9|nr:EamA family transporter [Aliagarivorans taiwanensis]